MCSQELIDLFLNKEINGGCTIFNDFLISMVDNLLSNSNFKQFDYLQTFITDNMCTVRLQLLFMYHFASNDKIVEYILKNPDIFNKYELYNSDLILQSLKALKFTYVFHEQLFEKYPSLLLHSIKSIDHMEFLFCANIFTLENIKNDIRYKCIIYDALNYNDPKVIAYLRDILFNNKEIHYFDDDHDFIAEIRTDSDFDNNNSIPSNLCPVKMQHNDICYSDAPIIFNQNIWFGKKDNVDIAIIINENNFDEIIELLKSVNCDSYNIIAAVKKLDLIEEMLNLSDNTDIVEWFILNVMTSKQISINKAKVLSFLIENKISSIQINNVSMNDIDNIAIHFTKPIVEYIMNTYNITHSDMIKSDKITSSMYNDTHIFKYLNPSNDKIINDCKMFYININVFKLIKHIDNLPINYILINAINSNNINLVKYLLKTYKFDSNSIISTIQHIDDNILVMLNKHNKFSYENLIKYNLHIKIFNHNIKVIENTLNEHKNILPKSDINKMLLFSQNKCTIKYVFDNFIESDYHKYIKYIGNFPEKILKYLKSLKITKKQMLNNIIHILNNDVDIEEMHHIFNFNKKDYINNDYKILKHHKFTLETMEFLHEKVKIPTNDFKIASHNIIFQIINELQIDLLMYCHMVLDFDKNIFEENNVKDHLSNVLSKSYNNPLSIHCYNVVMNYLLDNVGVENINSIEFELKNDEPYPLTLQQLNQCKQDTVIDYICCICHEHSANITYKTPCCNNDICELCGLQLVKEGNRKCPFCRANMIFI